MSEIVDFTLLILREFQEKGPYLSLLYTGQSSPISHSCCTLYLQLEVTNSPGCIDFERDLQVVLPKDLAECLQQGFAHSVSL